MEIRQEVAKDRADTSTSKDDYEKAFNAGQLLAYYNILSWMQQMAQTLRIPMEELALQGFDADRDLL